MYFGNATTLGFQYLLIALDKQLMELRKSSFAAE
jgi:hypothetical protein